MNSEVYIASDNIVSPLGFSSAENFEHLKKMQTGVRILPTSNLSAEPVCAAVIDTEKLNSAFCLLNSKNEYTRLEKMAILSISDALNGNKNIDIKSKRTLIIFSSTKGNIDLLSEPEKNKFDKKRLFLWETARVISSHFENPNKPLIVSNACVSGVVAIILGKRMLENNQYDNAVIVGADILTHFVVSGFQSFKAVSAEVAKPYDADRDGISLGEGCGTIVLTTNKAATAQGSILVKGGSSSNDANHISGPSRSGDGLLLAIEKTLEESGVPAGDVDYISGHGTATLFNDEMEALAITDAKLFHVPMNSLKSYFGHTLGAAGIIESIIGIHSMRNNTLIATYNYNKLGVSKPVNIIRETKEARVNTCLKTAAGFGGCNAAVLFQKQII
ncbi:MAG: beta-ketoacyl synthase [Bacteroidota bacterium]|nr:beta-ketoacyl synthase [Bacteroidota bacterium]